MVETIGPMVDEAGRGGPRVRAAHVAGGVLGGALVSGAVGAIGVVLGADGPEGKAVWVVLGLAAVALAYDLLTHGRRLGLARQTPMGWRHVMPPGRASFLYGLDLGTGLTTRIYFASYLVVLAAAGISGNVVAAAAIGGGFGLVRALVAVLAGRRAFERPTLIDDLAERRSLVEMANAVALVQFGVALALV